MSCLQRESPIIALMYWQVQATYLGGGRKANMVPVDAERCVDVGWVIVFVAVE